MRGLLALPLLAAAAEQCEVSTEGSLCLGGELLLPKAASPGILGYWSFDEQQAVDSSGNELHGGDFVAAQSVRGTALTAGVGQAPVVIEASDLFDGPDFAYTMWVLLRKPVDSAPVDGACNLLRKGVIDGRVAGSPNIAVDASRRITVGLTTTSAEEAFTSMAKLRYDAWYHVAVVRLGAARHVRLYVNGMLDAENVTAGYTQSNTGPLTLGSDSPQCGLSFYLDEVRAYGRVLNADEIGAEAAPALGGVEAAYVRFGCKDCNLDVAMASCPEAYHVCTALELHTEAYRVAKTVGWIEPGMHVWTHATEANAAAQTQGGVGPGGELITQTLGLGLCCLD